MQFKWSALAVVGVQIQTVIQKKRVQFKIHASYPAEQDTIGNVTCTTRDVAGPPNGQQHNTYPYPDGYVMEKFQTSLTCALFGVKRHIFDVPETRRKILKML
eukprot:7625450-Ditylum_brightwellii.AAC.1